MSLQNLTTLRARTETVLRRMDPAEDLKASSKVQMVDEQSLESPIARKKDHGIVLIPCPSDDANDPLVCRPLIRHPSENF